MQMIAGPCAARQAKLSKGRTFLCLRVVSVPQFRLEFPPLTPGEVHWLSSMLVRKNCHICQSILAQLCGRIC